MKSTALTIAILGLASIAYGQSCTSIAASHYGGWKPAATAPHDGTVVEMMQTYGVAPWYGLFKWTKEIMVESQVRDEKGRFRSEELKLITMSEPTWVQINNPGHTVSEDSCLFWRPYKGSTEKYTDPTGGAQNGVAYWCAAIHRGYDPKTDRCK